MLRQGAALLLRASPPARNSGAIRQALAAAWQQESSRSYTRSCTPSHSFTGHSFVGHAPDKGANRDDTAAAAAAPVANAWPCCPGHAQGGQHSAGCVESPLDDSNTMMLGADEESDVENGDPVESSPLWPQTNIGMLLDNNRRWVERKLTEDPDFFKNQLSVHKPEYLFIGCSDARLSVQNMLGLEMGQLFVHRNVANQVVNTDLNFITCLTYAVEYLKVENIIICGHYDCGGVKAAMRNHDHGIIEQWIMGIRDVARYHRKELRAIKDPDLVHRRMVELNVQEQALKLYANPVVQRSQAQGGKPHIHALVFDVGEGLLKELDVDFKKIIKKYSHVYSMYNFHDQKGIIKPVTSANIIADMKPSAIAA
eukprot:TRINITY_DN4300_c0_g1_i1.p1 TRINITY_DN4300_c0_g1~~TRINITY_DN4300_c0_g1_i1.p1  ORF type:complete len:383 (-),score=157.87 TRINITY_DN4300_c0_g1_i1:603-1706(-)